MVDSVSIAARGFALGLGLIVAIGAQNAFVLERGLARNHVMPVVLVCALSDAVLIAAGVGGLGSFIAAAPQALRFVTLGGALFLAAYAVFALRRAMKPDALTSRAGHEMSLPSALSAVIALTFLNPHVYLDTVVLLGSLSARYSHIWERCAYAVGAMAASAIWFAALGFGARLLAPVFRRPAAWRILDIIIAAVMAFLAISLIVSS